MGRRFHLGRARPSAAARSLLFPVALLGADLTLLSRGSGPSRRAASTTKYLSSAARAPSRTIVFSRPTTCRRISAFGGIVVGVATVLPRYAPGFLAVPTLGHRRCRAGARRKGENRLLQAHSRFWSASPDSSRWSPKMQPDPNPNNGATQFSWRGRTEGRREAVVRTDV